MPFTFDRSFTDLSLSIDCVRLVENLDLADPYPLLRADRGYFTAGGSNSTFVDATDVRPRYMRQDLSDFTCVALQGVKNTATAVTLWSEYQREPTRENTLGVNNLIFRAATEIKESLATYASDFKTNLLITGHSFGGAVAQVLAHLISITTRNWNIKLITFGAPKVGNERWSRLAARIPHLRWMSLDDPIQYMCPNAQESADFHMLSERPLSDRLNAYQHSGSPKRLKPDGTVDNVIWTQPTPPVAHRQLISWSLGLMEVDVLGHAIGTYKNRLLALSIAQPTLAERPRAPAPTESPYPDTPAQVMQAMDAAMTARVTTEREVVERYVSLPVPKYFRARKQNGVACVMSKEGIVAVASNSRRAKSIAKRGNQLVKDLQARNETDMSIAVRAVGAMV